MNLIRRILRFWYDFLVGDRWELFIGPILALVIVGVAVGMGLGGGAAGLLLFALIAGTAAFSVATVIR